MKIARRVAVVLSLAGLLVAGVAESTAVAAPSVGTHGDIGGANKFGLGGHLGSSLGLSLKLFLGKMFALQWNVGLHRYYYGRGFGFRAEMDAVWHFSVLEHEKFEMLIGPGVGGGVGYWRDTGYWGVCDTAELRRNGNYTGRCFGPFGKAFFHWSMAFHPWKFDVFAEPGFMIAFIPGVGFDWDFLIGARYYF